MDYRDVIVGAIPGRGLRGWYFMKRFSPSGWVAGFAVHDIDLAHWGLGLEHTGPVRVEGHGSHGLPMSVYEQVLGRVHLVEARIETTPQAARDGMCEWRERYPGAAVRAWMLPLLAL